jgi:hypothetical protein
VTENTKTTTDFGWFALIILGAMCVGSPDIIDGIVYKLTGVKLWECAESDCSAKQSEIKND